MGWLGGIGLALLALLVLGAIMQRHAAGRLRALLQAVAPKLDGQVEFTGYRTLPRLHYSQGGTPAELSSESNRGRGSGGGLYSYVWFRELRLRQFRFHIKPRHAGFKSGDLGKLKLILTADPDFDTHFALYSNQRERAQRLCAPALRADLMHWVTPQGNRLDEIRNDAESVVYATRGLLRQPEQALELASHATVFLSVLQGLKA